MNSELPSQRPVIVHFSTVHTWNDTRIFQRMCRSLAEHEFDVHWVVPCEEWTQPREVEGVTIHPVPIPQGRLSRAMWTASKELAIVRHLRPEVCHFHDPELMWVGVVLRLLGYRVVYDVHEDFVGDVVEKEWIPAPLRKPVGWVMATLEAVVARMMSAVVTAGNDIQARLGRHAKKCIAVRNYPSLAAFPDLGERREAIPPQIVFLGGINTTEVPQSLISAIELVPDDLDFEFVWGGKRADSGVLAKLKQRSGWSRVKFLGFVRFEEVNQLMRQARAAVVLYADAPNNYSIRSNRLFETMAVSLPMIGPSYGDWAEFFERYECGIAVDPHNSQEIADAMTRLLRDADLANQLGTAGRLAVEREFNWAAELNRLMQLYRSL